MSGGHGVVIAGAGLAGVRAARALRRLGYDGRVRLLSDEDELPYDRPPLSKDFLTGKRDLDAIRLKLPDEDVELATGTRVAGLDPRAGTLRLADGTETGYDHFLVATGARPRVLQALPPAPDIHYLRTAHDASRLRQALAGAHRVVVVGGGFIGLEVASAALSLGCEVQVIEAAPLPLAEVVGVRVAEWLRSYHAERGMRFSCATTVSAVSRKPDSLALLLSDGSVAAADVVVVGAGVVRETDWLARAGLEVHRGLVCDQGGRTNVPGVFGAGDIACLHHASQCTPLGHWTAAADSAERAARTIAAGGGPGAGNGAGAGPGTAADDGFIWSDQGDLRLQFAGRAGPDAVPSVAAGGMDGRAFVMHYVTDGRLTGVFAVNSPREFLRGRKALREAGTAQ
jgi:3-phenylpropionate/trans-cinnamate dioxygenase ferredoxin reductase component